jgi:hypothetical protein
MSTDEQRVRTEAGWIGVELSKSRVRTPGKAGYGLYRVRGSLPVVWSIKRGEGIDRSPGQSEPTKWTSYAFTLEEIARSVGEAIGYGVPSGPRDMVLNWSNPKRGERPAVIVPTRWTSAYRGSRVLGIAETERGGQRQVIVGAPLGEVLHDPTGCDRDGQPHLGPCMTARVRQREQNAEFQREHGEARVHGLKARHRAKLAARPPVERLADDPRPARGAGWVAGL